MSAENINPEIDLDLVRANGDGMTLRGEGLEDPLFVEVLAPTSEGNSPEFTRDVSVAPALVNGEQFILKGVEAKI